MRSDRRRKKEGSVLEFELELTLLLLPPVPLCSASSLKQPRPTPKGDGYSHLSYPLVHLCSLLLWDLIQLSRCELEDPLLPVLPSELSSNEREIFLRTLKLTLDLLEDLYRPRGNQEGERRRSREGKEGGGEVVSEGASSAEDQEARENAHVGWFDRSELTS